MNNSHFEAILKTLKAETLARMAIELEDAREDWDYYPEQAPPEEVQQSIAQTLLLISNIGPERAQSETLDFQALVARIKDELQEEAWLKERDRQERDNWLKDYE